MRGPWRPWAHLEPDSESASPSDSYSHCYSRSHLWATCLEQQWLWVWDPWPIAAASPGNQSEMRSPPLTVEPIYSSLPNLQGLLHSLHRPRGQKSGGEQAGTEESAPDSWGNRNLWLTAQHPWPTLGKHVFPLSGINYPYDLEKLVNLPTPQITHLCCKITEPRVVVKMKWLICM